MATSYKTLTIIIIIILIILVMMAHEAESRPGEWNRKNHCELVDATKREMCQRCAKQTKSSIVYPMCCNEEDEVHNWCYNYINYGKMV